MVSLRRPSLIMVPVALAIGLASLVDCVSSGFRATFLVFVIVMNSS